MITPVAHFFPVYFPLLLGSVWLKARIHSRVRIRRILGPNLASESKKLPG